MSGRKKAPPKAKELRAMGLAVPVSSEKRRAKRGKTRESLALGQSETVPTKHHHPKHESLGIEPGPASGGPGEYKAQTALFEQLPEFGHPLVMLLDGTPRVLH